jgi:hypothetical protein
MDKLEYKYRFLFSFFSCYMFDSDMSQFMFVRSVIVSLIPDIL